MTVSSRSKDNIDNENRNCIGTQRNFLLKKCSKFIITWRIFLLFLRILTTSIVLFYSVVLLCMKCKDANVVLKYFLYKLNLSNIVVVYIEFFL